MGDAELVEEDGAYPSAGERLRQAREQAGLTLEDIATQTRIPTRHLESLEASDFARLPAPTYTIGFAKNYAAAVGLDRADIGDQLRAEMGGTRPMSTSSDVFEPADPARAMPKSLIIGTIGALLLAALLFSWLNNRSLEAPDEVAVNEAAAAPAPAPAPTAPQGQGPVTIAATDRVWVDIRDGAVTLKQGELAAGESFPVPPNAAAPTLTTAKPEALRITVGNTVVPMIGEPANKVTVSLKGEDLLRPRPAAAAAPTPVVAPPPAPAPAPRAAPQRRRATPPPPPAPAPAPATTNTPATEPPANQTAPTQ